MPKRQIWTNLDLEGLRECQGQISLSLYFIKLRVKRDLTLRTGSFRFSGGTPPTLSTNANARDVLVFYTRDGGTTYSLGVFGLNFA